MASENWCLRLRRIPLYSIWRAQEVLGSERVEAFEIALAEAKDLDTVHDLTYKFYAQAVYGQRCPCQTSTWDRVRNGDLKLRAMLPISLLCGSATRFYFTPYPSMMITRETLKAILEDLAFGKRLHSTQVDYSGKLTPELLEAEYLRVQQLCADPAPRSGFCEHL